MNGGEPDHTLGPVDLGDAERPDPFAVQPGSILLRRFCVIGRVRHGAVGWRVAVTDLERALGPPPHHQLELVVIPLDERSETVIRRALPSYQFTERRVHAVARFDDDLALLVHLVDYGDSASEVTPQLRAQMLPFLAHLHDGLAQQGIVGLDLNPRQLRVDPDGRCQIGDWSHLLQLRQVKPDEGVPNPVESFSTLLRELGIPPAEDHEASTTARDLVRQAREATEVWSPSEVLPALPPFVGRQDALRKAHRLVAETQRRGPTVLVLEGPQGIGTSRLLEEVSWELRRGHSSLVVLQSNPHGGDHVLGVRDLMHHVSDEIEALPRGEREATSGRISRSVGSFGEIVRSLDARLGALVGADRPLPPLSLDRRFVRHATTAAKLLTSLGTARRPLVLLVDNTQHADASLRSVLYHLLTPGEPHHTLVVLAGHPGATIALPVAPVRHIVEPWTLDEVVELVQQCLPGPILQTEHIARYLWEQGAGVPSTTWEALEAAVRQGCLARVGGSWRLEAQDAPRRVLPYPDRLAWTDLPDDAKFVCALLSVRTTPVPLEWVRRVTRWPMSRLKASGTVLLDRRVALRHPDGTIRLAGEGVREQVKAAAPTELVARAHHTVARWLANAGQDTTASQIAWHLEHGTPAGADIELAAKHVDAGLEQLRSYDARRARWHFEHAIARQPLPRARLRALEGLADAAMLLDDVDAALSTYLTTLEQIEEPRRALTMANRAVAGMYLTGHTEALIAIANQALATVELRLPTGWAEAAVHIVSALWAAVWRRTPDDLADELCSLHLFLAGAVVTSHPHVLLSSVFRGWSTSLRRSSGPAAAARSMLTVLLATVGARRPLRNLLDRAKRQAAEAEDPFSLGIVHHYESQTLLDLGQHADGQRAAEQAIEAFHRAGDLSVAVITMSLAAFHALDREPTPALLRRLDAAEAAAHRHRNRSVLPGIRGMRLWVLSRDGAVSAAQAVELAADIDRNAENADLVGSVVADAMAALALDHLERPDLARHYADRANTSLDNAGVYPPFLQVARLAAATVAVRRISDRRSARLACRHVNRLLRAGRQAPVLAMAARVTAARLHVASQQFDKARRCLEVVVAGVESHGQLWQAMAAHDVLSRVLSGRDAPAAQAHAAFAGSLRHHLHPTPSQPLVPVEDQVSTVVRNDDTTRLDRLVETLDSIVARHLRGHPLEVHSQPGLLTNAPAELAQLLLVNLVLAASDAAPGDAPVVLTAERVELSEDDVHAIPNGTAGAWHRLRVRVDDVRGEGARGALAECGDLCRRMSGFLDVAAEGRLDFSAWLPAPDNALGEVGGVLAIVVADRGVARTLVDGVRRLGFASMIATTNEHLPPDVVGVLSDRAQPPSSRLWHARVVQRQTGWTRGEELPVPFLVRELQELLEPLRDGPPTAESAGHPTHTR